MKVFNKLETVFVIAVVVLAVFASLVFNVGAEDVTLVDPVSQVVGPESFFSVDVFCTPGQPIKSFELKFSFDASLVQVNSVAEGDIFSGFETYFNSGVINNSAGTVVNVYGLILGAGNVSDSGSFVIFNMSSLSSSGVSALCLYDVGVTNETEYVSITVNNGTVQVDATAPEIVDNSPSIGTTGDSFTFNVSVSDNVDDSSELVVMVDWLHGSVGGNESMSFVGGSYFEKTVVLDDGSVSDMTYTFYTYDSYGNSYTTTQSSVTVLDNDDPLLTDVIATPATQNMGDFVNITAEVTDNIEINNVYLNITYPDDSILNFSITANKTGDTYYCNKNYSILGTYTFFLWADDSSNNHGLSSTETFLIAELTEPIISNIFNVTSDPLDTNSSFGWVNVSCDVTDNVAVDEVFINITNPDGSDFNVSMISGPSDSYYYNSSTAFSTFGNYSYFVWANDTSGNVGVSSIYDFSMPPNWDVDMNGVCKVYDLTLISNHYEETGSPGWIREDVDNNGVVEVLDLVCVSNHYNETWWV